MAEKTDDRRRQVETTKKRYGPDYYVKIGEMRGSSRVQAKYASWRRWHPTRFNEDNTIKQEWRDEFYASNNQNK